MDEEKVRVSILVGSIYRQGSVSPNYCIKPDGCVFVASTRHLWVVDRGARVIRQINLNKGPLYGAQIGAIHLNGATYAVGASQDGKIIWYGDETNWVTSNQSHQVLHPRDALTRRPYDILTSLDGRYLYLTLCPSSSIGLVDTAFGTSKIILTQDQYFGDSLSSPKATTLSHSLSGPYRICFDRLTDVPESAVFISSFSGVYRLQLAERREDVVRYRIRLIDIEIQRQLIFDLWLVVADYLAQPPALDLIYRLETRDTHQDWCTAIAMLPSDELLCSSRTEMFIISPPGQRLRRSLPIEPPSWVTTTNPSAFGDIEDIALDENERLVYVSDARPGSILKLSLPTAHFISVPKCR